MLARSLHHVNPFNILVSTAKRLHIWHHHMEHFLGERGPDVTIASFVPQSTKATKQWDLLLLPRVVHSLIWGLTRPIGQQAPQPGMKRTSYCFRGSWRGRDVMAQRLSTCHGVVHLGLTPGEEPYSLTTSTIPLSPSTIT